MTDPLPVPRQVSQSPQGPDSEPEFAVYARLIAQVRCCQDLLDGLLQQLTNPPAQLLDRPSLRPLQDQLAALQSIDPRPPQDPEPPRLAAIDLEIRKQLRLIQLDCQFLQTARQSRTQQQRLESIRGHLELLDRYGQAAQQLWPIG
jgi:hypothetical protein